MKVKNRLALQFTFMFAVLLGSVLFGIYALVKQNTTDAFYDKLDDRALTAGQNYLAENNMTPEEFKKVVKKYPLALSHEVIRIYTDKYQPAFIKEDSVKWSKAIIREVIDKRNIHFTQGKKQVSGLYYIDDSGNFIVLVSAIDDSGNQAMRKLAFIMLFAFLASLVITFFLGRLFALVALQPILKITAGLKIIRSTSLNKRLPLSPQNGGFWGSKNVNDEINLLSTAINNLLEHLEQSFHDQQSFITNASHELRTPLTKILGKAEVCLKNEREKEDYKSALQHIIKEAEKLDSLISSLLELSQASIDSAELQKIRLDELLWEVADEITNSHILYPISTNPVKVNYNLPDNPDKFTIQGNRRLLFIAISNILKNAIKFSTDSSLQGKKQSPVQVNIFCNEKGINITIKDEGIGIEIAELQHIFQPFYRAPNAFKLPGSGIGLSLAEKIIRLHNGKIHVKSQINKGTEFLITFGQ